MKPLTNHLVPTRGSALAPGRSAAPLATPRVSPMTPAARAPVGCAVEAVGAVSAAVGDIADLRKRLVTAPPPATGLTLPATFLKHADEQTVLSLAAVFQAVSRWGRTVASLRDWAVLAGPRFIGRVALHHTLQKFAEEGAWGVSPHLIPHRSLHSVSGTVSQALTSHGPNFGVGGGPTAASETILSALSLVTGGSVPGVIMVVSGWSPEPFGADPDRSARAVCHAVALGLVPVATGDTVMTLRAGPESRADNGFRSAVAPVVDPETLGPALAAVFPAPGGSAPGPDRAACPRHWRLRCGGWMELDPVRTPVENVP